MSVDAAQLAGSPEDEVKTLPGVESISSASQSAAVPPLQDNEEDSFYLTFPSANEQLTDAEFERACELIDYYIEEGNRIVPYCVERGRDPDLFDRGNVWQEGFVDFLGNMMLSKKYNNLNRMRLIAWHFSAYRLFDLSSVTEPPPSEWFNVFYSRGVEELPDDVDSLIHESYDPWHRMETLFPRLDNIIDKVDAKYLHSQPLRFGEIAASYRGFMVNGDSIRYWGGVAALYRTRVLEQIERKIAERGMCRVLEIGPGYGGLAYQLKKTYGDKLQFIAVDLVESLIYSSIYLTTLFKEKALFYTDEKVVTADNGLVFVPSFRSPEFFRAISDIDLCINTISMNEMTAAQVDYYAQAVSMCLAKDGIFFECNRDALRAGPGRIEVKSYIALQFAERLSVENTEVAGDGNLDIWSHALSPAIVTASEREYPASVLHYRRGVR